jgi:hypothetical protein
VVGSLEELVRHLAAARDAAQAVAGRAPIGLRAVETGGGRWYLCAFEGPAFLCLDAELRVEASERRAREVACAGLLYERLEQLVDPGRLRELAAAAGRAIARGGERGDVGESLVGLAQAALDLAAWREAPERALASVLELDVGSRLHERVRAAYGRFVAATDPLAAAQDTLPPERVEALRGVEEAAGRAGLGDSLARRLGATIEDCDEGAVQVVAAHLTRLADHG